MSNCPKCGAEVAPQDNFCPVCGASLTSPHSGRSQTIADLIAEHRDQIAENPDDASARYSLGLAYLYDGQPAAAADQFTEITRLAPDFAQAYAKLAIALSQMRNYHEARRAINQARQIQPDNEEYCDIADRLADLD